MVLYKKFSYTSTKCETMIYNFQDNLLMGLEIKINHLKLCREKQWLKIYISN